MVDIVPPAVSTGSGGLVGWRRRGPATSRARLGRMYLRSRRPIPNLLFVVILTAGLTLTACGTDTQTASAGPSGAPSAVPSAAGTSSAPSAGASAPDASAPAGSAGTGSQTETEWGRIWDNVPAGFPTYPGSTIADDTGEEPVSARYAIAGGGDPAEIASWMQAALETATFSTESLSGPLEDGSFVLDSVGDGECRLQVTIAPMGGLTFVTVRYGAACPAP